MATAIGSSWTQLVSYASTYSGYTITYKLYAMYTAESIANNTHTISLKWTTTKTSGGTGVYDGDSCTPTVTNISGGNPSSWTGSAFTIPTGSTAETTKAETTGIVVTHSTNGAYSATWSWSLSHVYSGGSKSGTVDVTLPTIARASSIALSSNSILTNGSTTATITGSTAFTHNITTTYNSTSYTLASGVQITSGSSVTANLTIPTGLRSAMKSKNASSVALTLTLTTLSGSTTIGTATTSLTVSVPTATVTVSASSVSCNSNITWTLGNIDTSACTYTVQRLYGSTTVYTDTTKATTTSKAVANAAFEPKIVTSTNGTATVKVTTYVGNTTVGTNTVNYTVTIPTTGTNSYHPSVSFSSATRTGSTYGSIAYLAGHNGAKLTFRSSITGSSAINSRTVSVANNVVSASISNSENTITVTTGTFPASNANYTVSITVTVTDKRGVSASATTSLTVSGYTYPSFTNYSATRATSGGVADTEGTYANITATGKAGVNASLGTNAVKLYYTGTSAIAQGNPTATKSGYGGNFALTSSYTFTAKVTDTFGFSTSITITLASASYILSLHPSGGVGMGKVAVANRVESAYPIFTVNATGHTSEIRSGDTTSAYSSYVGAHGLSGKIYLVASGTETGNKALTAVNKAGTTNDIIRVNQGNQMFLPVSTFVQNEFIINSAAQTPGIYYRPTNTSADSNVMYPGRIYYQTSVSGSEGRFAFREYSPTAADPTIYTTGYEYYFLPAPAKDMAAGSTKSYNILTTKNLVTVAQGGTGQSSLADVTVGNATNASKATLAYRLESALAGKSGTTTTNRWYRIGTCTITGANTDITTVIVVSCPYGSMAYGGAQWGIARIKLRSGASGSAMSASSCALEWLASMNLAPTNFKLLIDTTSTDNTRTNELWVYADASYRTWTVTKLTESSRSAVQENNAQGWKFTNNYAAEGKSAVTSGLTEVTPTFALSNGRNLYNNATGTTDAITLAETAANFTYLKIYYYSVHGSTKIYDSTEVYSPEGKQISLATNIYWSNAMVTTMRQVSISGTALSNPSNEQAQFSVIAGSSPTRTTGSLIYIYRIDGFR